MKTKIYTLKSDKRPLYDQTIQAINQFIEIGSYEPGDKLPGEAEFAKLLGVSRPTLREAIGSLELYGIVKRRHGVGTFVTAPPKGGNIHSGLEKLVSLRSLAKSGGTTSQRADWHVEEIITPKEIIKILDLTKNSKVVHSQMTAVQEDNKIITFMESFIPADLIDFKKLYTYKNGSTLNYLIEHSALTLSYTQTKICAIGADINISKWLKVPLGTPLLLLEETFYSDKGQSLMHEFNYFLPKYINFHITRRISSL